GEITFAVFSRLLARLQRAVGLVELVGAEAGLAFAAVHEGIGESLEVTRGLPDTGVHQDGTIDAFDVGSRLDHRSPPRVFYVALERDTQRSIVPAARQAAVDFARLKGESAPLGEVHDFLHGDFGHNSRVFK